MRHIIKRNTYSIALDIKLDISTLNTVKCKSEYITSVSCVTAKYAFFNLCIIAIIIAEIDLKILYSQSRESGADKLNSLDRACKSEIETQATLISVIYVNAAFDIAIPIRDPFI